MERNHICKKCGGIAGWDPYFQSWICTRCGNMESKPITNYDRIISKTPEELAKFIEFVSLGCDYMFPDCPAHDSCKLVCDQMDACRKGWLDWLKQEAKE